MSTIQHDVTFFGQGIDHRGWTRPVPDSSSHLLARAGRSEAIASDGGAARSRRCSSVSTAAMVKRVIDHCDISCSSTAVARAAGRCCIYSSSAAAAATFCYVYSTIVTTAASHLPHLQKAVFARAAGHGYIHIVRVAMTTTASPKAAKWSNSSTAVAVVAPSANNRACN